MASVVAWPNGEGTAAVLEKRIDLGTETVLAAVLMVWREQSVK
jgi:hypothetical protein